MCHALLSDPRFLELLLRIDHDLAAQVRAQGCACSGALHRANYPRKPRGCSREVRGEHSSRLSFCCSQCRKRTTPASVRFLGRRVYLGLAVVLVSAWPGGPTPAAARLGTILGVSRHTVARWRQWWREQFPRTPLWRAGCARFMPPLADDELPGGLLDRFAGPAHEAPMHEALMRLLVWLSPASARGGQPAVIELREGR